jgi:DNA-binding response OmpR family regulator
MKKILIVEDDKRIAAALAIRLSAAGYEVLTAANGLQGLKSAVVHKPALILTDIWMPHPIGFLNRERMHNLGLAGVPVIYITASKKKDLRRIALEEGAAAFFEKPYDAEELLSCIAQAVARTPTPSATDLDREFSTTPKV